MCRAIPPLPYPIPPYLAGEVAWVASNVALDTHPQVVWMDLFQMFLLSHLRDSLLGPRPKILEAAFRATLQTTDKRCLVNFVLCKSARLTLGALFESLVGPFSRLDVGDSGAKGAGYSLLTHPPEEKCRCPT